MLSHPFQGSLILSAVFHSTFPILVTAYIAVTSNHPIFTCASARMHTHTHTHALGAPLSQAFCVGPPSDTMLEGILINSE